MLQTDGKTQLVELTHGVSVWLCRWHASEEFRTMRSGRDFELTLFLAWRAQNCYSRNHAKALAVHRREQRTRRRRSEHDLPGSYHWKALRNEAEERFASGESLASVRRDFLQRHADDVADAPSERTIRRWYHDGRWRRACAPPFDAASIDAMRAGPPVPSGSFRTIARLASAPALRHRRAEVAGADGRRPDDGDERPTHRAGRSAVEQRFAEAAPRGAAVGRATPSRSRSRRRSPGRRTARPVPRSRGPRCSAAV